MRAFAVGLGLTACTDLFGPSRLVVPTLRQLSIDDLRTSLRDGGILYINAYPEDTAFRLDAGQRFPVEIVVSSGDRERARLYREICPFRERGPFYPCFQFDVFMKTGFDVRDLADRVAAIGGRFNLVSSFNSWAEVTVFDPEDLVSRVRRAASWPGVAYVEFMFPFCAPDAPGCSSLSDLTVPLPVDTGVAVPGDGTVQLRAGDTLTVLYKQPDGLTLQAQTGVP